MKESKIHGNTCQETLENDIHVFLDGNGEADTHFSYARRARQFVEGTKIQERYLCGPRLEAQLTGRAESAVEGCRPSWLSTEHGVETLLRFLRTHCAKLALPDMGSHLQAFFYKLKRKKYEPMATESTRYRNEYTKVRRALARLQRTEAPDEHPYFSPQGDQSWNWFEKNSEEVMEWDERSDADSSTWSSWTWNSCKTNRGNTWNETHHESQQTELYVELETNNIRYECHVVTFRNNSHNEIVTTRDQKGSASSVTVHTGPHSVLKSKGNQERRRQN